MQNEVYQINKNIINKQREEYCKKYPEKILLASIKQRCNNPKVKIYKYYGGRGIECRITEDEIKQLMIRDGYWNMDRPSIDRKDNDENYNFKNCRFIELSENCIKDIKKPVIQFDLDGNFIKEWESMSDVQRQIGIAVGNISMCCNRKAKSAGGFIWKFKELI